MKKIISKVVLILLGISIGIINTKRKMQRFIEQEKNISKKHLKLYLLMNQWVKIKQEGKSLVSYFEQNKYKKIAIYGMSYIGNTLLNELKDTKILVAYGIDQKADEIYLDIDVLSMDEDLEEVDVVIVTAISDYDEIKNKLKQKIECPIVSLQDILDEVTNIIG